MLDTTQRSVLLVTFVSVFMALMKVAPAGADEPDHVRGQIMAVQPAAIEVQGKDGTVRLIRTTESTTFLTLSPASFADVEFGAYVGAVSERMDERFSPSYRDSLSWLHKALELRVVDEKLRGIALGHMKWDLTPSSVMTHGWIDDLEDRVISVKYGPTDEEETDVEIGRDIPIQKMTLADRGALAIGAQIFAGTSKGTDGSLVALFVMIGVAGAVPGL